MSNLRRVLPLAFLLPLLGAPVRASASAYSAMVCGVDGATTDPENPFELSDQVSSTGEFAGRIHAPPAGTTLLSFVVSSPARRAKIDARGDFSVSLPLTDGVNDVQFIFVDPQGNITSRGVIVRCRHERYDPATDRTFGLGLGYTAFAYEYGRSAATKNDLAAQLSWRTPLGGSRFGLRGGVSASVSALPGSRESAVRFFWANVDGVFPLIRRDRWRLNVVGGLDYASTWGESGRYGYRNLHSPHVYPEILFWVSPRMLVGAAFSYALASNAGGFYSFENRLWNAGAFFEFENTLVLPGIFRAFAFSANYRRATLDTPFRGVVYTWRTFAFTARF